MRRQELAQLAALHDLLLNESFGHGFQGGATGAQRRADLLRRAVDDLASLQVDLARRALAVVVVAVAAERPRQESRTDPVLKEDAPQGTHAELGHHAASNVVGL